MHRDERLWVMVDVETSGPVYGRHSMTELGAAVGSRRRGLIDEVELLITPISNEVTTSRGSFARARERGIPPAEAMARFSAWMEPYKEQRAELVARPAAFDWPWIVHYAWTYLGSNPFGFRATCASSWLAARGKRFDVELPHRAVEDAKIQLWYFLEHF